MIDQKKFNYESVADVPTKELVDVLCETQKEKWAAETVMQIIMNELVKRKDSEKHE